MSLADAAQKPFLGYGCFYSTLTAREETHWFRDVVQQSMTRVTQRTKAADNHASLRSGLTSFVVSTTAVAVVDNSLLIWLDSGQLRALPLRPFQFPDCPISVGSRGSSACGWKLEREDPELPRLFLLPQLN